VCRVVDLQHVSRRAARPRWLVAVGAAALLLSVWAGAVPGAVRAISMPEAREVVQQGYDDTENPTSSQILASPFRSRDPAGATEAVLGYLVMAGLALVVVVGLWLVVRHLLRPSEREPLAAPDAAVDLDLEELARAVSTGAQDRLAALAEGTPAQGVIAAWTHLEASVHAAGVSLPVSRTSTEVTVEVLRHFPVDRAVLGDLAGLYREARWSRHPMTEEDRERAAAAYRALDDAVRAPTPPPVGRDRG